MKMNKDRLSGLLKGRGFRSDRGLGMKQNSETFCFGGQTLSDPDMVIYLFLSDHSKAEGPPWCPYSYLATV